MFFRIKKIKGKEYAYLVENEWNKKSSRQKVKSYLGKVYRFNLAKEADFLDYLKIQDIQDYVNNNNKNKIISDLIEWELFKFGIDKEEFSIDLNNAKIQKNRKRVALFINEGFMCGLTLKNLLNFELEGDEQNDGYRLARTFVEAGIKVPQEVFVGIFSKLYKN